METLVKIICFGFAAFYVLGLLLFLIAPLRRSLMRRFAKQDQHIASHNR